MKNQHFQGTGGVSEDSVAQTLLVFHVFPDKTEESELTYLVGCAFRTWKTNTFRVQGERPKILLHRLCLCSVCFPVKTEESELVYLVGCAFRI